MDQVKDFLRACVKYRFWIAVGIAALMPLIAYFVGAGTIQAEAASKEAAIKTANDGVTPYIGGAPYNQQYSAAAEKVYPRLETNVANSWQALYDRQAPLLRWPDAVHEKLTHWGRRKPDTKVANDEEVAEEIDKYRLTYPKYVEDEVYRRFNPFDYETGEGVVVAPSKDALLRPVEWKQEEYYNLSDIWAAQEKLWIQATMLQVVADVNKDAKTWDEAPIRQINSLEVASDQAQDQVSLAQGKELTLISFEGEEEEVAEEGAMDPMMGGPGMESYGSGGGRRGGMMGSGGMMGPGGMMGGSVALSSTPDEIYYVQSDTEMFQIVPVYMSLMVRQDKVIDYLCALENSPMEIQVLEIEQSKPAQRLQKPEKGSEMMNFSGYMGYAGMMGGGYGRGMMEGMEGMMGPGGMSSAMGGYGRGMMGSGMMGMEGMAGMPGMGFGGQAAKKAVGKGEDVRSKDAAALRKKIEQEMEKRAKANASPFDPYFDIVQVSIYGQARFYRKPPEPEAAPASEHEEAAAADEGAAEDKAEAAPTATDPATDAPEATEPEGQAPPAEAAAKAEGEMPKAEGEAPKAEGEAPKAEGEAPEAAEEAPKAETPAEPAKAEAPAAAEEAPQPATPEGEAEAPKP